MVPREKSDTERVEIESGEEEEEAAALRFLLDGGNKPRENNACRGIERVANLDISQLFRKLRTEGERRLLRGPRINYSNDEAKRGDRVFLKTESSVKKRKGCDRPLRAPSLINYCVPFGDVTT